MIYIWSLIISKGWLACCEQKSCPFTWTWSQSIAVVSRGNFGQRNHDSSPQSTTNHKISVSSHNSMNTLSSITTKLQILYQQILVSWALAGDALVENVSITFTLVLKFLYPRYFFNCFLIITLMSYLIGVLSQS